MAHLYPERVGQLGRVGPINPVEDEASLRRTGSFATSGVIRRSPLHTVTRRFRLAV